MSKAGATVDAKRGKGAITPDARIIVLVGKEVYFHAAYARQAREVLAAAHGGVDVFQYDGSSAAPADVLDECRSFGLMQSHKLVIVDEADHFVKDSNRALVERYAQSPSDAATLMLRCAKWNKGKLDDLIKACGCFVACDPPADVAGWCVRAAKERQGMALPPDVARALVARAGSDLGRLSGELAKLAAALPSPEAPVTRELVEDLVGDRGSEEALWSIQEWLLRRDPAGAVAHLRSLMDNAPRDSHVPITVFCTDLARKVHAASRARAAGETDDRVASRLRLWGPSRESVLAAARRTTPRAAAGLVRACVRADANGKSGVGEPSRTLELLVLRFSRV